jgi:starch synthase
MQKGNRSRVVMLATENDALRGAKVGGIGDVIRDLPGELQPLGWDTTVIIPSYGFLHTLNPSQKIADVTFPFGGREEFAEVWRVGGGSRTEHLLIHHPAIGGDPIYFHDSSKNVYARDSTKFALFCSAAGQYLRGEEGPYVLHLHDWHTGYIFLLAELHPAFAHLRSVRKIFTIHNVGYQGTRPMRKFSPSLEDWFPELFRKRKWIRLWEDTRYEVPTFTPMLAGIRHAAMVTTVSPTYAKEITTAGDRANAVYGGEGLEVALRAAHDEGRLVGILNGVEYPGQGPPPRPGPADEDERLVSTIIGEIHQDKNGGVPTFHDAIPGRLKKLLDGTGRFILSSITRISEQKVRLMFEKGSDGVTALDRILSLVSERGAGYVFIGSGAEEYERALGDAFRKYESFVFLDGFYKNSASVLFRRGNLFVMPSSYEPCGITQMQAMREGQPCLVHGVGGLKDTVTDGGDGFVFGGETLTRKVDNFVGALRRALDIHRDQPARWREIVDSAKKARFRWEESAKAYAGLYAGDGKTGRRG